MIKSCKDCETPCCRTGPGPWDSQTHQTYLDNFNTTAGYNTECEHYCQNRGCTVWGTAKFPLVCRTFICNVRQFSEDEINEIDRIEREVEWSHYDSATDTVYKMTEGEDE